MRKLIIFLLLPLLSYSQINLVPNADFEEGNCPDWNSYMHYLSPGGNMFDVSYWFGNSNIGSPDYYTECSEYDTYKTPSHNDGYQEPKSGQSYCGVFISQQASNVNAREYISVPLTDSLISQHQYLVGLHYSTYNLHQYSTKELEIQLSDTALVSNSITHLEYNPGYTVNFSEQINTVDTAKWIEIKNIYIANGGEKYLTIGAFKDDETIGNSLIPLDALAPDSYGVYIYIDDVFVYPLDSLGNPMDTVSMVNDMDTLTDSSTELSQETYFYSDTSKQSSINHNYNLGISKTPPSINIAPNPTQGELRLVFPEEKGTFILFNLMGQKVFKQNVSQGENKVDLHHLPPGLYQTRISTNNKILNTGKIMISR